MDSADVLAPTVPTSRPSLRDDLRALVRCPRELWLVFAATTFEYVGVYSFLVTLALWLTSDFHLNDQRAGWWAATFSMLTTLFMFFVGSIADILGIRRTLVLSFGLSAGLRAVLALAPSTSVALSALIGFAFSFAAGSPVLQASVHRYSTRESRAFAFSLWYVSLNIGGVISGVVVDAVRAPFIDPATHKLVARVVALPLLGPTTMSAYRAIMGLGTLSAGVAFLVTLLLRTRVERERREGRAGAPSSNNALKVLVAVARDKAFWRFLLLLALLSLVRMMFQHMHFTWPKYVTRELGDDFPWGKLWGLNSLLILGLAPLATVLTRNRATFQVLLIGAFISAASPFVLCFGSSYPFQLTMVLVLTVGEALWSPRSYEYTLAVAPPGRESTYASLAALPFFLAKFLVGPSSGYLLAAFCPATGPRRPAILWAFIGVTTMIGPIGIFALRRVIQGRSSPGAAA
jgi:proton-dependent oligopeptide transporter, POT family